MRWGPLRLRPFFTIQDTGYDSNIYRRRTDVKSDFTSTFSPGFDLFTYLGSRGKILLKEQVDVVLFAKEDSLNHINSRNMAELDLYMTRFFFRTQGALNYIKERPNNEIDIRTRSSNGSLSFSSTYRHSSRTSASLTVTRASIRYKSDDEYFGSTLSASLDRNEDSLSLGFSQKMLSKTTITLEGEEIRHDFLNDSLQRDMRGKYYKLGFKFDPSAFLNGNFRIGYASLLPEHKDLNSYRGPVGDASLSFRIMEPTRISLSYSKGAVFSIFGRNLYSIQNSYGVTIFQHITKRFGMELGGTLFKSRYSLPEYLPLEQGGSIYAIRMDEVKTGFAGVKFRINEQYNVGLRAMKWKRASNVYTENVEQIMIGSTFAFRF
ncbi:MAG: outer membrane beta-barrel protein [Acidobacteriota bacterium]